MINLLMRQPPIILQQIILLRPRRLDQLLRDRLYHHPKRSTNQSFPSKDLDVECGANEEGRGRTRISAKASSGMSVSFAPWCLGTMSCGVSGAR